MPDKPVLRLDTTGQYLGGPMTGPHDNAKPVVVELSRHIAQFDRLVGH